MFLPNDPCLYKGEPLTVVRYLDRRTVETVADETGEVRAYPEHKLARPIKVSEPPRLSDLRLDLPKKDFTEFPFDSEFQEFLMSAPVNWNGHFNRGVTWEDAGWYAPAAERRAELFKYHWLKWSGSVSSDDLALEILEAYKSGTPLQAWVPVSVSYSGKRHFGCNCCEAQYGFETNGVEIRVDAPCPHPDGLVSEATLNVPSGKLIVRDSLSSLNPLPLIHDINKTWGQHRRYLAHAKMGEILGQVGNTCPNIIRLADGSFQIGKFQKREWYDAENNPCESRPEDAGDYDYDYVPALPEGAEEVAGVCTDVWAYAIMDYDDAARRAEALGAPFPPRNAEVIEVVPGTYRFRHYNNVNQRPTFWVAGSFERIGPATEPEDFVGKWLAMQVTPGQVVQALSKSWPTLYGSSDWGHQCMKVLISVFGGCVPDRDWHPNGFRNDFMPGDLDRIEDREIPRLRFHTNHSFSNGTCLETTVSRKDKHFGGDVPLNPSHARAALRVLENQISFGVEPWKHEGTVRWDDARSKMREYVKLFHGVLERYPDAGEGIEDFTEWLDDEVAVKRWISNYGKGL